MSAGRTGRPAGPAALALALLSGCWLVGAARAAEKPLLIPQEAGERQGKIVGRSLACGVERTRVETVLRRERERMLAAVGPTLTEERYAPSLGAAVELETSLGAPSEAACAAARTAFARLEAEG